MRPPTRSLAHALIDTERVSAEEEEEINELAAGKHLPGLELFPDRSGGKGSGDRRGDSDFVFHRRLKDPGASR